MKLRLSDFDAMKKLRADVEVEMDVFLADGPRKVDEYDDGQGNRIQVDRKRGQFRHAPTKAGGNNAASYSGWLSLT